jgi:hypothetical protein
MSRGVQTFKQGDVTKAIKAAVKAGVKDWRIEIAGKIIVTGAAPREEQNPTSEANEWDSVK